MAEQNDESYSEDKSFETGVHQWSILGPLLFISYLLSLRTLLIEFLASYHIYTDDITFYLKFDLGTTFASFLNHRKIIASVLKLLTASKIKINSSNTQCMFVTNQRTRLPESGGNSSGAYIILNKTFSSAQKINFNLLPTNF